MASENTFGQVLRRIGIVETEAERFDGVKLPFPLRQNQVDNIHCGLYWDRFGLFDDPRCLPGETEFLTPTGWKRLDAFVEGDLVGQVDPDSREVSFVTPERYIVTAADKMVWLKTSSFSYAATEDHKMLFYVPTYHRDGRLTYRPFSAPAGDLTAGKITDSKLGVANTFKLQGPGIPLSEPQIRVMVAVIADGYFSNHAQSRRALEKRRANDPTLPDKCPSENTKVVLRLKKQRKKDRLENLLVAAGIQFICKPCAPEGFSKYEFYAPRLEKEYTSYWWGCSAEQLRTVVEEAEHWDGSRALTQDNDTGKKTHYLFSTGSRASADFIQYAAAATGRTASLMVQARDRAAEGRKPAVEYSVSIRDVAVAYTIKKTSYSLGKNPDESGKAYCFTVPTGFFVTRFRGKIVLTGNCGKTICMQLLTVYFARYGMRSIVLMPPILFDQYKNTMADIKGHGCSVETFDYSPAKREAHLVDWQSGAGSPPDVLLMSKEIFRKHHTQFPGAKYKALLFDECHRGLMSETLAPVPRNSGIKKKRKVTSTYYDCIRRFMQEPEARLVLSTGSPLPNDLYQAFPIISLKSPQAYHSRREFDNLHVTWGKITIRTRFGAKQVDIPDPKKFREVGLLHKNLYDKARRVLKLEVLGLDVPNVQIVPIHLSTAHHKVYKDLLTQRVLELEGGEVIDARQDGMLRALAMRLIVNPEISGKKVADNAVLQAINALCDTADLTKTKVVLFAYYNDSVEYLVKALAKHNPAMVYGPNGSEKNRAQAARFVNDESCRLLVASPGSGGVGLTLGGVSQTVIVVEPITTPGAFDQAVSRVILAGQTEPVSVYILQVMKTLSPKGIELMMGKNERVQEVMLDRKTVLSQLLGG